MEKPKDYYSILGVERDASVDVIKRAYRRLARKLRPQRGHAVEALQDVQVAYETLADAERRRSYDQSLSRHERSLTEPLSRSFVAGNLRRPVRPSSLTGEILLTRREAADGGVLPLSVPVETQCPTCEGTGGFVFDCAACYGEGSITRRVPVPLRIPVGVSDGAVFQVCVDEPSVTAVWLTVHILPY